MKKILFLILISLHAFSQVFEVDTTFKLEPIFKRSNFVSIPEVRELPNGQVLLYGGGNVVNGLTRNIKGLILDKEGKIINEIDGNSTLDFNNFSITADNKFLSYNNRLSRYEDYKRYELNGSVDTTFKALSYDFNFNKRLLPQNSRLIILPEDTKQRFIKVDENRKIEKIFYSTQFFLGDKISLVNMVYNDLNELFLLISDDTGARTIVKTDMNFEIDRSFIPIQIKSNTFQNIEIGISKNELITFISNVNGSKYSVSKYDRNGSKTQSLDFDNIDLYSGSINSVFYQKDGSIDLISSTKKHLKILSNFQLDPVFTEISNQEKIKFLHAFKDGTYLITQNEGRSIEKMNADGSIDSNFKITFQREFQLFPNQLLKLPNNNFLVGYDSSNDPFSPFATTYNTNSNYLAVYNSKNKIIHEFYDGLSSWEVIKRSKSVVINRLNSGDKSYVLDDNTNLSVTNFQNISSNYWLRYTYRTAVDSQNDIAYKLEKSKLLRTVLAIGKTDTLQISSENAYDLKVLSDGRFAIFGIKNGNTFIDIYTKTGERDKTVERIQIETEQTDSFGVPKCLFSIEYCKGFIVALTKIEKWKINQSFIRFNENGSLDEKYVSNQFVGGQYVKYLPDGTIFTNSGNYVVNSEENFPSNFFKILPNGKIDSLFEVKSTANIANFEFEDENTIFAITENTVKKFVKSNIKKTNYFSMVPLPTEIPWNFKEYPYLQYRTSYKNIKVIVTGDAVLEKNIIKPTVSGEGLIDLKILDDSNRVLVHQKIKIKKIRPYISYTGQNLPIIFVPTTFSAQSSAGLQVKLTASGKEFINEFQLSEPTDRFFDIKMVSEETDQYERVEIMISAFAMEENPNNILPEGLVYYPNPVKETLIVESKDIVIATFKLFAMDGREIPIVVSRSPNRYEISLKNLLSGVYILQSYGQNLFFHHRIMVD